MDRTIEKSLKKIQKKEEKLLQKSGGMWKPLTDKVEEKIPAGCSRRFIGALKRYLKKAT